MDAPAVFRFGSYCLNPDQLTLWRDGTLVPAAPRVLAILATLLEANGDAVAKKDLLARVWQDSFVEDGNLTQTIYLLRKTLGKTPDGREFIETLPRRGYRIAVPVERGPAPPRHNPEPEAKMIAAPARATPHLLAFSLTAVLLTLAALAVSYAVGHRVPRVIGYTRLTNDGIHKEQLAPLLLVNDQVLFTEIDENRNVLASVSTAGGEVSRRAGPHDDATVLSASPDMLFFGSMWHAPGQKFSIQPASAQLPRPFVGDLSAHGASWSTRRQMLVLTRGHDLLLSNRAGTSVQLLAHLEGIPFWPRWSPDGSVIRFSVHQGARFNGIYQIAPGGSAPAIIGSLGQKGATACCGEWTPDGRYFIFVRERPGSSSLWVRNENAWHLTGAPARPLSTGLVDFWRSPTISSDGRHLYAVGETLRGELHQYDRSTGDFPRFLSGGSWDTLSFSRDGAWIAYTKFPEGTLWRSRPDGSDLLQLTPAGGVARFPQWSPDGRQIAFIAAPEHQLWQVYVIPAAGGTPRLVAPANVSQGVATWSPDGRKLAFGSVPRFAETPQDTARINLVDLTTGHTEAIPGSENTWTARWSPNGRYLAATTLDRSRLLLYDFSSSTWSVAAQIGVNDLAWSADSQKLFIDAPNGNRPQISVFNLQTHALSRFLDLSGIRRTGFDGWRFSLGPNDEPLLLEQAGTQEVYRLDLGDATSLE